MSQEYPRDLAGYGPRPPQAHWPGGIAALERFIRYARSYGEVWWCRRVDIARHWHEQHPMEAGG